MKKIGPRVTEQTEAYLTSHFSTLSAGSEYIINAAPAVARKFMGLDIKGEFSPPERMLMIDVMNGTILSTQIAGQHLQMNVADGIALDHLDEKWEIDGHELTEKLKCLSTPELFFLEIWIQGFWMQNDQPGKVSLEEYVNMR